jgi:NADH-quinone oxidoreductase subunit M
MDKLLVATILLPLIGAGLMWVLAPLGRHVLRWAALAVSLLTTAAALWLVAGFEASGGDQFAWSSAAASPVLDVRFAVALDGLSLWLFALSAVLLVSCVLVSWNAITEKPALYYAMLLLLESGCLGVFASRDIMLFYIFFEFTLLPLFFLIGIWGSEQRRYAAVKFFLYTLAGSLLTFLGLLVIVLWDWQSGGGGPLRFSIPELTASLAASGNPLPADWQWWVFLALFVGFAIKVPLFPLHTWLPLAHVQAPTAGSVFLAGILLKIGTYGFLRFSIPMLPAATAAFAPWLLWLSVIGIIYGALVALAQTDMKRLIAYSSVSHLGYCMLGIFALNRLGLQGGALQMVNHGISTGALFALVGMLYERYHTREISHLGGLCRRLPWLAFFMVLFTMSSIGLPGLNGFSGELPILLGMFQRAFAESPASNGSLKIVAVLAVFGVVLGAWYMLYLVQRVFFGPLREGASNSAAEAGEHPAQADVRDLSPREIAALAPLALLAVLIGVYPKYFLDRMEPSLVQAAAAAQAPADFERRAATESTTPTWENLSRAE